MAVIAIDATDTPAPEADTEIDVDSTPIDDDDTDGTSADAATTPTPTTDDDDAALDDVFDKDRAIAKINKVNAEARNLRKEVKRLKDIEALVQADEDAKKSDLDKAIARADAAEARLKEADQRAAVLAVKDRFDLPAKVLAGLEGTTLEELIESAEEWAEELGIEDKSKRKTPRKTDPKELDGGRKPNDPAPLGRTVSSVVDGLQLWR